MRYNFCTLFDRNYATRGIALYRSLERHCVRDFRLSILCMDTETRDLLAKLNLPKAELLLVEDLNDPELLAVRETRPKREFCWTCPGPLLLHMLEGRAGGEIVTYLDADLAFFSDPQPVFDEMGGSEILIHEHRFAPPYANSASTSGIFNVGLMAFRKGQEALACLRRWRAQCIDICVLDPEKGYCGDQKYLDEWPTLYKNLKILQHPGAGLAPWNIENYTLSDIGGRAMVDGKLLIFYHYHALVVLWARFWGLCVVQPSAGYFFTPDVHRLIYRPYARMLRKAQTELDVLAASMPKPKSASLREIYVHVQRRQFVIG